jgi:uncharacterized protein (TIGR03437 family)
MAVDRLGNIYIAGTVWLTNPALPPSQLLDGDVFVTKLDPTGHPVYTTYFGGDGLDQAHGISTDAEGNVYIVGETASGNFPAINAVQPAKSGERDAFVCKLNPSGGFVFCTYLGGEADDYAYAVAADSTGVYVTGLTYSQTFPVTAGALRTTPNGGGGLFPSDAFVSKLSADGSSLVYSTYLGGTKVICNGGSHCVPAASHDSGQAIAVDSQGNAYIAGTTNSSDFPVTPGAFQPTCHCTFDTSDAFISKLNPSGSALVFSTYLGGTAAMEFFPEEGVTALALGSDGDVYVTGSTSSPDFPTTPGAYRTALAPSTASLGQTVPFVTRLNASGTALVFSTFLSSQGPGSANAIQLDSHGNSWVTGTIAGNDFPLTPGAFTHGGGFAASLAPDGSHFTYATRLPDGFASGDIAVDANLAVYLLGPGGYVSRSTPAQNSYVLPPILGIANFAGVQVSGRVAPGELVTIFGTDIGTDVPAGMKLDANGIAASELNGTQVLFDSFASPLIHSQKDQIDAVVPSGPYQGSPVTMQILRNGAVVAQIQISMVAADPAISRVQVPAGSVAAGAAAALNQDQTINTPQNPAPSGTVVSIFGTGFGPTNPPVVDGEVSIHRLSSLNLPVTVTLAGTSPLEVLYAGQAPGLIAGAMQINFRLPNIALGPTVYLSLQIGDLQPVDFTIAGR